MSKEENCKLCNGRGKYTKQKKTTSGDWVYEEIPCECSKPTETIKKSNKSD